MNRAIFNARAAISPRSVKRPRVLVVEDEVIVAMDFEQRLKRLGYTVAGVEHDGRQVITKNAKGNTEVILMHNNLSGGMSSIESAVTIRQRHYVPVIYFTAYSDPDTVRRAAQSDPFGYILKPFEDRELETAIQVGMVKHEMEHRLRDS